MSFLLPVFVVVSNHVSFKPQDGVMYRNRGSYIRDPLSLAL